jgi:DNA polymerase III epsilon subunit-like protein
LKTPKRWAGNRLDSIEWARNILKSDAVIVDTETTGLLDNSRVEVIELAIITMQGEILYRSRFRPKYRITKRTIAIHGISNEDVKNNKTFAEEFPKINSILNSKIAIAYKSDFDKGVIKNTCKIYKLDPPECRWECAMNAYRAFQESGKWLPLPNSKHSALDDCNAVLSLIDLMAKG